MLKLSRAADASILKVEDSINLRPPSALSHRIISKSFYIWNFSIKQTKQAEILFECYWRKNVA